MAPVTSSRAANGVYNLPMPRTYDLHTHSTASDGTLSPSELVARAAARGIGSLALTDHDTTAGVDEARTAAAAHGIEVIAGVEVSVSWRHAVVHVVGLQIATDFAPMQAGFARLAEFRDWRAEEIGRRLAKAGIPGALEGAMRHAHGRIVSRTHFAHFLVEAGHAKDLRDVFKRFLVRDRPGYVPGQWASLEEAVGWICGAGGIAVVAHPARYPFTATKLRELLGEFRACGGVGLEVISGSHSAADSASMAAQARRMKLLASVGSDYHGPENPYLELGGLPALPADLTPVWALWTDAAHAVGS